MKNENNLLSFNTANNETHKNKYIITNAEIKKSNHAWI